MALLWVGLNNSAHLEEEGFTYKTAYRQHTKSAQTLKLSWAWDTPNKEWMTSIALPRIANESVEESLNCARELKPGIIDFGLVKKWKDSCESWHEECRIKNWCEAPQCSQNLCIINVKRRCLIKAPQDCRYIALSYVWGGTTGTRLTKNELQDFCVAGVFHPSRHKLPQTLEDAVILVPQIDEQYL